MPYQLCDHVSFCWTEGRAVFLDARRNRYFCLGERADAVFKALCRQPASESVDASVITTLHLIQNCEDRETAIEAACAARPTRSLTDDNVNHARHRAELILEIGWALALARWRLKHRPFLHVIETLRARKLTAAMAPPKVEEMGQIASAFAGARRFVPIRPICLADSLALLDLLDRRGLSADLVFGVKLNPFSAHCWVQAGELILNDGLDTALRHTAILVV